MKATRKTEITIEIEGQKFVLSESEAKKLRDALDSVLNDKVAQAPIILEKWIEKNKDIPYPYKPSYPKKAPEYPGYWPDIICRTVDF